MKNIKHGKPHPPVRTRQRASDFSRPPSVPASLPAAVRDPSIPAHRAGRLATGLYPHVSRTKLAELTGRHITTIAGILRGRTRVTLDMAMVMAKAIGIPVEKLNEDLRREQEKRAANTQEE